MTRFILGVTHPRRLKFFIESVEKVDFLDKVFAENMPPTMAYTSLRNFALDKGYDYLILTSDDVVVGGDALRLIMDTCMSRDIPVVTGWSLVRPYHFLTNVTLNPPREIDRYVDRPFYLEHYGFLPYWRMQEFKLRGVKLFDVWFVGFSLTAIRRDALREWTPRGWYFHEHPSFQPESHQGRKGFWASQDMWFSYEMGVKGFRKVCVVDAYVPHEPVGYSHSWSDFTVGKLDPMIRFEKVKGVREVVKVGEKGYGVT
jgi:hypothetical protein